MKNEAIKQPEWLTRSAIYQINLRTFSAEGTVKSVTRELGHLKSIGFKVVYLCPIFSEDDSEDKNNWSIRQQKSETENPKNPYRMNDYFDVDSEYGTMEDLKELTDEAHRLGMKVLLDLVYAHIGPNAPIIKKHPEFVQRTEKDEIICTYWRFPALDFRSEGLREYLYTNMTYYIGVIDVDGFRCDVGDRVPVDFWLEARKRIRRIKSDAVLINEGDKYENLTIAFDSSYFFNWHEALYKVFADGESPNLLKEVDCEEKKKMPLGGLFLRDIDNHDTVTDWPKRVETAAGHEGMEQIMVINYLIDGIPMVYSGNELACEAKLNMFANRFHMGKFSVTDRNKETAAAVRRQEVVKALNEIKANSNVLRFGTTEWLESASDMCILFKRELDGAGIIFVGNASKSTCGTEIQELPEKAEMILSYGAKRDEKTGLTLEKYGYAVFSFDKV